MRGIAWFYRLRAIFRSGVLKIAHSTKVPLGTRIIWKRGDVRIGDRVHFRKGVVIDAQEGSIEIGNHVSFNDYTILLGRGGIVIGNDVRIAAHAMIVSFDHNFDDVSQPIRLQGVTKKPIIIEDDVWIGAGAKILGGAHVAKGCVIGANAVVKGKTKPYGIYVGAPARLLKRRGETGSRGSGRVEMLAHAKK
ncbi:MULTISPECIES: acyltransferase [Rhizobium]|uniref:Acetyltransferase n=1 Tax=Rhizobium tropici TaxID=398 RepID=A0A329Y9I1_RHITR|nr:MULTISPECIES: acyltransferase [Rhizobium]MBB3287538.1 acetyltransferase-like isoleucine patch superfamily enzyme [Rhizobium sp. BK252]MBB3402278.1 acetyltransferase-like isoleucine patch superfamily enzyme [Rhizobium sp. BK289]MBB3414855.1 acetyltransferase-like isoleucine patch superfamily enzyme [Rhizobium sp. BK284]MBB3482744.1 acetyltransferase-like isoleucine patch superfamily enzyme [Rhizobium sp. BK347]MDK4721819.1 acyltransferase [Rhizobium sp. CNPSo 3968]